jgi:hypothetical protein
MLLERKKGDACRVPFLVAFDACLLLAYSSWKQIAVQNNSLQWMKV